MTSSLQVVSDLPSKGWLEDARAQAKVLVESHLLPGHIKTPEQAIAIMMRGRELRVPPWQALTNIYSVNGKPTCSSELMLALIYRDHGDTAMVFTEESPTCATMEYRRRGWTKAKTYSFTIEDAKRAELLGKGTWKAYPAAMLRARCISAVARMAFPDSIGGMYTPEELDGPVDVDESFGAPMIDVETTPIHKRVNTVVSPPEEPESSENVEEPAADDEPIEGEFVEAEETPEQNLPAPSELPRDADGTIAEVEFPDATVSVNADGEIVGETATEATEPAKAPTRAARAARGSAKNAEAPHYSDLAKALDSAKTAKALADAALNIQNAVRSNQITAQQRSDLAKLYDARRSAIGTAS